MDNFKEIERRESKVVQNLKINGLYCWPIIRYTLRKHQYPSQGADSARIGKLGFYYILRLFDNLKYQRNREFKYTFIESEDRRSKIFGDLYTYVIKNNVSDYNILVRPPLQSVNKVFLDSFEYSLVVPYIKYLFKTKAMARQYFPKNRILEYLVEKYSLPRREISLDLLKFYIFYRYFLKILKKLKIKRILLYCGYNITSLALVQAAHELKISCGEIQHGNFHPSDGAYHYGHGINHNFTSFYSDYFLCFNNKFLNYINQEDSYFYKKKNSVIGFPIQYMIGPKRMNVASSDEGVKILLILPFKITSEFKKIMEHLIEVIDSNIKYELWIRVHPNADNDGKDFINSYRDFFSYDQLEWRDSIVEYDYFVGESSTTLLEAESINKRVYLINTRESKEFSTQLENPKIVENFTIQSFSAYEWSWTAPIRFEFQIGRD